MPQTNKQNPHNPMEINPKNKEKGLHVFMLLKYFVEKCAFRLELEISKVLSI